MMETKKDEKRIEEALKGEARIAEALQRADEQLSPYATRCQDAVYRNEQKRDRTLYRNCFQTESDAILNNVFYSRLADKTQVHSFYRNDDISRRMLHVQIVSKIARTIGKILNLNLDLIEVIALGHDIGHTPFGHKGEEFLSAVTYEKQGRYFNHNAHSVRVLSKMSERFKNRYSIQTLDGILSHNGEMFVEKLSPTGLVDFQQFDKKLESCYTDKTTIKKHVPSTLEGCVVRVSDIIAYITKDRNDLYSVGRAERIHDFEKSPLGEKPPKILYEIMRDLLVCSLDKPYIAFSNDVSNEIKRMKDENNRLIYQSDFVADNYRIIEKKMRLLFDACLNDLDGNGDETFIKRNFLKLPLFAGDYNVGGEFSH